VGDVISPAIFMSISVREAAALGILARDRDFCVPWFRSHLISPRTLLIIAFLFFHYWKKISLRLLRAVSPWGHSSRVGALGLPMTKIPAWKVEAEKMRREGQMANIFLLNQTKWDWVYNIPIAFETKKLCLQFSDWFWNLFSC